MSGESDPPLSPVERVRKQIETFAKKTPAFAAGPIREALLRALSSDGMPAVQVASAADALAHFKPNALAAVATLFAKAGTGEKVSPKADAAGECQFLLKAIADGATGKTLTRLAEQIRGHAPKSPPRRKTAIEAMNPIDAAVAKLCAAMDDQWGTDEATVFDVLDHTEPALLAMIAAQYEQVTGHALRDSLKLEFEGPDLLRVMAALDRGK